MLKDDCSTSYVLYCTSPVLDINTEHCGLLSIVVPDLWPLKQCMGEFFCFCIFSVCTVCVSCTIYCWKPLHRNVKLFRAFPLKTVDVVHIVCFISKHFLRPESCQTSRGQTWKPALGFNPAGSRDIVTVQQRSLKTAEVRRLEVTVFYYEYCEMSSDFCGNIIFK